MHSGQLAHLTPGSAPSRGLVPTNADEHRNKRVQRSDQAFVSMGRVSGDSTAYRRVRKSSAVEGTWISPSALTFVLCFLIAFSLVMAANILAFLIYQEVNRRLPRDAQFSVIGARWKLFEVVDLHGQMFPDSPKRWQMWTLAMSGFAFAFGAFFALWILPR